MRGVLYCLLLGFALVCSANAAEPERLFYLSNGEVLQGLVYKPAGKGPFPALVYNQNTSKDLTKGTASKAFNDLAQFFTRNDYVLFVPGRKKWKEDQDENGTNTVDVVEQQRTILRHHEEQADVVFSAIETLKAQSFVNTRKIFVSGYAGGAITSLLLAEKDVEVRGYVIFSPAAGWWTKYPALQSTVRRCVKNAKAPVFLIQPENDHNLAPAEVLGKELEAKGTPNRTKVYPPFGKDLDAAKGFSMNGAAVWGDDVLSFCRIASK